MKITVSAASVEVVCSCEGGLNARPCEHAAAALKAVGWLGDRENPKLLDFAPAVTPEEITRLKGRRSGEAVGSSWCRLGYRVGRRLRPTVPAPALEKLRKCKVIITLSMSRWYRPSHSPRFSIAA